MTKRIFKKLTILIFIYIIILSTTKADNYYTSRDYLDSQLYITSLITKGERIPKTNEYILEYDENLISEKMIPENMFWNNHISTIGGRYRRVLGVNDHVRIPPSTKVDVYNIVKNEAGHDVIIRNFILHVSTDPHSSRGNCWTNFDKTLGSTMASVIFNGEYVEKLGRTLNALQGQNTNILNNETKVLHTATLDIFQSFDVLGHSYNFFFDGDNLKMSASTTVQNNFGKPFPNVEYVHGDFTLTRNFEPNETFTYNYVVNYGPQHIAGEVTFDSFEFRVPHQKECAVNGSFLNLDNFDGTSRFMQYQRNDTTGSLYRRNMDVDWYPGGNAMCIEVIPYTFKTQNYTYFIPDDHLADINMYFQNDDSDVFLGDDLVLNFVVHNTGGVILNDVEVFLDFSSDFQSFVSSDCDFSNGIFTFNSINIDESFSCEVVFQTNGFFNFLVLKNNLVHKGDIYDQVNFFYYPDLEISLSYEDDQFIFNSSFSNLDFLEIENFSFKEIDTCKRYTFLELIREICYYTL